ncbi:hypothetical protein SCE1572_11335 [Sorangium cellulosum So0157-2]|uniref:Protein kinase domain-containing protein n=3 Tax=Sorangium cellulosum TaxID=56 RepID=S4XRB3_SORCE|nr:hypothetical protein SCE1572_11335 [Sorangium cellulosum So0157-2]
MGTIVAAWHLELDQRVAMKFLHSPGTEGGDPAERFRREARALARIKSEHVARVLDVGSMQGGMPYMVMEFLEGNNLAEEIRARGPLPVVEAVGYVLEAIEAMAEAHAAGIVHRDLKPANLFLARRPDGGRIIKVLDFGISKSMLGGSRDELALTKTAALLGSPLYMSPEQVRCAKDVDARTDIWALGVIVYEMLIGRTPYNGDSVPQLFASLLHETPPTMAQLRADVPRELDAVVMHCLAKDPEQRWRNVGDLAAALLAFGPAGSHVHVERARRVLGLPGARPSAFSQPGISLPPPGAATGGQLAGARLSVPHGAPSPAASADTGPAVSRLPAGRAPGERCAPRRAPAARRGRTAGAAPEHHDQRLRRAALSAAPASTGRRPSGAVADSLEESTGRMRRHQRSTAHPVALGLCAALISGALPARAEPSAAEKATAEALFDAALDLMKQGRSEEACPRLEQSHRIDPGIGTLLYLAECYENTGRTASAWATFRQAASESRAAGQAERSRKAQARAARLEPGLSKLSIGVAPENLALQGFAVRSAGKPVEPAIFGIAIPVDPGEIAIEASAPGHETWKTTVKLGSNKASANVDVPALKRLEGPPPDPVKPAPSEAEVAAPAVGAPAPAPAPAQAPAPAGSRGDTMRLIGLVVGGAGVVGLGVGTFFGVKAISKNGDAEGYCKGGSTCEDPRGVTLTEEASSAATGSNIAFGLGAAALAGGAVLYFVAPRASSRVEVGPVVGARNVGLRVGGTFQ